MFFKYPYTDMYNLNLDWMLQAIREVQEIIDNLGSVVNSVNGESGAVTISPAMINAAEIGTLQPFDHTVTIDDISESTLIYLYENGKRILAFKNNLGVYDRVYFLYKIGTAVQAIYYNPADTAAGVRTINGQSGDLILNAGTLPFNSLEDPPMTGTVINGIQQDIGDTADLETTAHVLVNAINELLGALNIEAIARVDGDNAVFAELAETVALILTVDDSDIAEETISVGQYVYFDGILYQCIAAITSGVTVITDLSLATYLTQVPNGGLNDLKTLISDETTARTDADNTLNSQKLKQVRYNSNKLQQSIDGTTFTDVMTVDSTPTNGSNNPVSSGGVYSGVDITSQITPATGTVINSAKQYGRQIVIQGIFAKITAENAYQNVFDIASGYRPTTTVAGNLSPATNTDLGYGAIFVGAQGDCKAIYSKQTVYGIYFTISYLI